MLRVVYWFRGLWIVPDLDLKAGFNTADTLGPVIFVNSRFAEHIWEDSFRQGKELDTHMSSGYTRALARTAPDAPATAYPHGGKGGTFDCAAILSVYKATERLSSLNAATEITRKAREAGLAR